MALYIMGKKIPSSAANCTFLAALARSAGVLPSHYKSMNKLELIQTEKKLEDRQTAKNSRLLLFWDRPPLPAGARTQLHY